MGEYFDVEAFPGSAGAPTVAFGEPLKGSSFAPPFLGEYEHTTSTELTLGEGVVGGGLATAGVTDECGRLRCISPTMFSTPQASISPSFLSSTNSFEPIAAADLINSMPPVLRPSVSVSPVGSEADEEPAPAVGSKRKRKPTAKSRKESPKKKKRASKKKSSEEKPKKRGRKSKKDGKKKEPAKRGRKKKVVVTNKRSRRVSAPRPGEIGEDSSDSESGSVADEVEIRSPPTKLATVQVGAPFASAAFTRVNETLKSPPPPPTPKSSKRRGKGSKGKGSAVRVATPTAFNAGPPTCSSAIHSDNQRLLSPLSEAMTSVVNETTVRTGAAGKFTLRIHAQSPVHGKPSDSLSGFPDPLYVAAGH